MTAPPAAGNALLDWLPRLRRYARVLTHSPDEADDLVQDTLERAWSRAALWPGVHDMRAWLFAIMHNLHAGAQRRPRLQLVALDDTPAQSADAPVAATQEDGLALRDLQAALDQLSDEQRQVLLLVALEGLRYAEVAQLLDIPVGTVMSRLSRARERLRQVLAAASTPPHATRREHA